MNLPKYENRTPFQIVNQMSHFESSGRAFRALSWLDYAKSNKNVSALEYAALETRLAIEQLLFEQLVISAGKKLNETEYKKCSGSAKDLSKMIERLTPKYEKLIDFTKAIAPIGLPITKWDNRALGKFHGKVSNYLHWSGGLDVTVQSEQWFNDGLKEVEIAASYIWEGVTTGNTAITPIEKLEPELKNLWKLFFDDKITIVTVIESVRALEPMLKERLANRLADQ